LTGSIGLDVVARRANVAGALIGLEIFPLEPFSKVEACAYLNDLCQNGKVRWPFALDGAGFEHLANQLGWLSPYYLKLISDRIQPSGEKIRGLSLATIADIDRAFDQLLMPVYRGHFTAWEEHLKKNFPKVEADILHAILESCCSQPEGETVATMQARLVEKYPVLTPRVLMESLSSLANDGFLSEIGDRWCFRSGLLRRYWVKYISS
jgi:hypothetical protein